MGGRSSSSSRTSSSSTSVVDNSVREETRLDDDSLNVEADAGGDVLVVRDGQVTLTDQGAVDAAFAALDDVLDLGYSVLDEGSRQSGAVLAAGREQSAAANSTLAAAQTGGATRYVGPAIVLAGIGAVAWVLGRR